MRNLFRFSTFSAELMLSHGADILLDSVHDLTKLAGQQMVRDILQIADASLWAIDGRALTNSHQRLPLAGEKLPKLPPRYAWYEGNSPLHVPRVPILQELGSRLHWLKAPQPILCGKPYALDRSSPWVAPAKDATEILVSHLLRRSVWANHHNIEGDVDRMEAILRPPRRRCKIPVLLTRLPDITGLSLPCQTPSKIFGTCMAWPSA